MKALTRCFRRPTHRVSYLFGLRGPSVSIDTACSSSLVGAHYAARDLTAGDADAALATGVSLTLSARKSSAFTITGANMLRAGLIFLSGLSVSKLQLMRNHIYHLLTYAGMLTMDGRCKSLDAAADGYVRAENCIAFLLTAVDMEAAHDALPAAAVAIRGSAVNQDGRSSSLTAPNGPAQQGVMRAALPTGDVSAVCIGILEMHGTGTPLGDPIEVGAAMAVMQVSLAASQPSAEADHAKY